MEIMLNALSIGIIMALVPAVLSVLTKTQGINTDVSYRVYGIVIILVSLVLGIIPILMNIFPNGLEGTNTLAIVTIIMTIILSLLVIFGIVLCKYSVEIRYNKIVVTGWTGRVKEYSYNDIVKVIEDENKNIIIYFKSDDKLSIEKLFKAARLHLELYLENHNIKVESKYTASNFVISHKTEEIVGWVYLALGLILTVVVMLTSDQLEYVTMGIITLPSLLLILYARKTRIEFKNNNIIAYRFLRKTKEINYEDIDYIKKYQDNQAIAYKVYCKDKFKFKVLVSEAYKGSYYFEDLIRDKHWSVKE